MWEYLREYDTIIIVDDSASMKMGDRWQAVRIPVRYEECLSDPSMMIL